MNLRLVLHLLGALSLLVAMAMLPSLALALLGDESAWGRHTTALAFGAGIGLSASLGLALRRLTAKSAKERFTASEGFAVVVLGWLLLGALGALPLYLTKQTACDCRSGEMLSPAPTFTYLDACFETISGFTTTGASVFGTTWGTLNKAGEPIGRGLIERLPPSFLFWRSLTHWLGGMGIVVLCLALLPTLHAGGSLLFQAEVPGPTAERLQPRIRETAAILYGVYVLLTVIQALLLRIGGMPLFDSLCHTFGTMATGGFSTKDASIGYYSLPGAEANGLYVELVIDLFMFLAGCNFLLHFHALRGRLSGYGKNPEFRFYVLVVAVATLTLTVMTRLTGVAGAEGVGGALRQSLFQTLSIVTTTGFCTADFDLWPTCGRMLLVLLMFFGGCTGSTGGGLKQLRVLVVCRCIRRELLRLLRPGLANQIRVGEETLPERLVASIVGLSLLWIVVFALATLLVSLGLGESHAPGKVVTQDAQITTAATAVAATLNNIGPGLSGVGATCNYGWLPDSVKAILILCMLMGRLEIYSVVVLLLPLAWRR